MIPLIAINISPETDKKLKIEIVWEPKIHCNQYLFLTSNNERQINIKVEPSSLQSIPVVRRIRTTSLLLVLACQPLQSTTVRKRMKTEKAYSPWTINRLQSASVFRRMKTLRNFRKEPSDLFQPTPVFGRMKTTSALVLLNLVGVTINTRFKTGENSHVT